MRVGVRASFFHNALSLEFEILRLRETKGEKNHFFGR